MGERGICVVIDGGAATGKTTTAREVARCLSYDHLSTGLLYRAVAWLALRVGVKLEDEQAVAACLMANELVVFSGGGRGGSVLRCGGESLLASALETSVLGEGASVVSAQAEVRGLLLPVQRNFAAKGGVVLDGRDLGTVVLPEADLKVFLQASLAVRSRRRLAQLKADGQEVVSEQAVRASLALRDARDTKRSLSPLQPAADAHLIDTDTCTQSQQIKRIVALARMAGAA